MLKIAFFSIAMLSLRAFQANTSYDHYLPCIPPTLPSHFTQLSSNYLASDFITSPDNDVVVEGHFAYGTFLPNQTYRTVEIWGGFCGLQLTFLGESRTDGEGNSRFILSKEKLPGPGVYPIYQSMKNSGKYIQSFLRVLPKGTRIAVFDIDGTLTRSDGEFLYDLFNQGQAHMREQANKVVDFTHFEQGYEIVYLTGRSYLFNQLTRTWLQKNNFVAGTLQMQPLLPGHGDVKKYKLTYLLYLQSLGFQIDVAYGNASTDIDAYLSAGIPPTSIFILGKEGGEKGSVSLGEDFVQHYAHLSRAEIMASLP